MQDKIKNIRRYITSVLGVLGIASGIYWGLQHAKFGLLGIWFGRKVLDMSNSIMSAISDWVPYFVIFVCVALVYF